MALSQPRQIFGIHSFCPYSRTDYTPYGILKVLGSSKVALTGALVSVMGGDNPYAWAVERGAMKCEIDLKAREYPDFMFQLLLGHKPTDNVAEASASCSAIVNFNGTSLVAATGVTASPAVISGSEVNAKFTKVVVVVASATTVDVYALTDVDFARGNTATYLSDALKVATGLAVAQNTAVNITSLGVKLTGGAGTIGMTTGDSGWFSIRPINTKSMDVTIGVVGDTNPSFGCVILAQKRSTGEMFEIDCFNCLSVGLPLGFDEFKWSEADVKVEAFYDSVRNGVFQVRQVNASTLT